LDETLVHSSIHKPTYPAKLVPVDVATSVWVSFRPYVRFFLEQLAPHYELIVWTAGTQAYGEAIVRELDPTGNLITHALYRQHCTYMKRENLYAKDLTFLDRDMERVRLCDNNPHSFRLQRDRGILVPDFIGDPSDMYLLGLCHELIPIDDVDMEDCEALVSLSLGSGNTEAEAGGSELVSTPALDKVTTEPPVLVCPLPPVNDTNPPTVLPEPDAKFNAPPAPDDDDPPTSDAAPPVDEDDAARLINPPAPAPDDDPDVSDTDPPSTAVFIVTSSPELVCGMYVDILRGSYKGKTGARVTKVMNKMVRVAIPGLEKERNIRMTSIQPR
jgi:RNA polymerase II subunit A small phosphatase-like protein